MDEPRSTSSTLSCKASTSEEGSPSFEEGVKRLEAILEQMGSSQLPLEKALALYEEAEKLLLRCSGMLTAAETKVQELIKERNGALALTQEGRPQQREFPSDGGASL